MAHLKDIPARTREHIVDLTCPTFEDTPAVSGPPLSERRVALVSSAALHAKGDLRFVRDSAEFRSIDGKANGSDIVMSHISVNFDRNGFQQDLNVVLPLDRLAELADADTIGSVAATHYACMGSTDPIMMREQAAQVAGLLKADRVDAILLVPV